MHTAGSKASCILSTQFVTELERPCSPAEVIAAKELRPVSCGIVSTEAKDDSLHNT